MVSIQSSLATKLPALVQLLSNQANQDPFDIQNEFRKYCELLQFKNGELKVTDKANKLVDVYRGIPSKFKEALKSDVAALRAKLLERSKLLDQD